VLHIAPDGGIKGLRVVVECRTGAERVTGPAMLAAIENREAHAAILVTESASLLPRDAEPLGFRIYFDDRSWSSHYDPRDPSAASMLGSCPPGRSDYGSSRCGRASTTTKRSLRRSGRSSRPSPN
jgi:hypothetical protein